MRPPFALVSVLALAVAAGCGFQAPGGPGANQDGGGGRDGAGSRDAAPDGALVTCVGDAVSCDGDDLVACVGGTEQRSTCATGCTDTGVARCAVVVPSNGIPGTLLEGATAAIAVPAGETWVVDADTGSITTCLGPVVRAAGPGLVGELAYVASPAPDGGVKLGAFAARSISIAADATLRVVGESAIVFQVAEDIVIEGTLDVSAGVRACGLASACGVVVGPAYCQGPGGFRGGVSPASGTGTSGGGPLGGRGGVGEGGGAPEGGGGGGGHGGAGGSGGGGAGGGGGDATPDVDLEPLFGGGGGGEGGSGSAASPGLGGGGGGGVQLTARGAIRVGDGGRVLAGGSGGLGASEVENEDGGGGGGAGGGVLLEAPEVAVLGVLAANGGGGGGGNCGNQLGLEGSSGGAGITPAPGGVNTCGGGAGGAFGAPTGGQGQPTNEGNTDGTGGGGGGVGRVFVRSLPAARTLTGTISPAAVTGALRVE